ncbi:MAG TPA: CsiV family protein [Gammaproteobacteria bacterium]
MKLFFLTFTLLILSGSLQAEEVGYEVEVIIFEDATGTYAHSEIWQEEPATSTEEASAQIQESVKSGKDKYTFLSSDKYRLMNQAKKLGTHADYKVLYHRAWKQVGLDRDMAFPVHIDSRNPVSTESLKTDSQDTSDPVTDYIDGTITLIMSRYLHINTDLIFHKQVAQESLNFNDNSTFLPAASHYRDFPVKFERRMRSREVHYIDHPMVGIIVMATPYKILEKTTPNSPNRQYKSL